MTQKSCAVGVRNAKPGNHLKGREGLYLDVLFGLLVDGPITGGAYN